MTSDSPHLRMGVLGIVAISLFAALFSRLWFLQVMSAPTFAVAAQTNRERVVDDPAGAGPDPRRAGSGPRRQPPVERGDGRSQSDREDSVIATSSWRSSRRSSACPIDTLHARVNDQRYSPLLPIPLAEDVPESTVVHIAERESDFPGVQAKEVALRVYPYGSRAAHVLGYVGAINDTEYKTLKNDGYTLEDQVGKDGVEKIFEKDLRGTPGSITLEVDSAGRVLRELTRTDAIPGRDVQLTIDLRVQALAEDSLATALLNARTRTPKDNPNHFAAPGGSVVVLDPTTGAVVAMASYPTFDPREFVGGVDPDRYQAAARSRPTTSR